MRGFLLPSSPDILTSGSRRLYPNNQTASITRGKQWTPGITAETTTQQATIQSAKERNCLTGKAIRAQRLNNNEWHAQNQRRPRSQSAMPDLINRHSDKRDHYHRSKSLQWFTLKALKSPHQCDFIRDWDSHQQLLFSQQAAPQEYTQRQASSKFKMHNPTPNNTSTQSKNEVGQ